MTAAMFDTHAYVKKLTAAGVSEQQAEVHAEVLADVLDSHFASKHDIAEVNRSIQELAASTQRDMKQLEVSLRHEIAESAAALRRELAEVRADTLKWMAGLLLAQASLIVAAVKLL